ncbi:TetR/AcrR family transcriptional regulator [Bradyrhizobium sp. TM233]|uniref:TetR/AcrR family transcriptional regulator n=1 Tax=Bradyrhizobium sp. TM233 TaxID=2599801 RepID=UPI0030C6E7AC|nr:TetR/AcrR family transcriptional regulator [Bradyrhizobium sp. TM233]
MVQKSKPPPAAKEPERRGQPEGRGQPKRRGRPRAYEPDVALGKALDLFRTQGFAATSLDDLSEATGMNRPSLYGAFGDKRELYIKSYQRYRENARASMVEIFREEMPVRQRLERIFASALNIYLSGETGPRGCFTVVTAASEAVGDPEIRAMVLDGLTELDKAFANCFRRAKEKGELPASADPVVLAQIASATVHTIAIRSRARVSRKELEAIVKGAIDVMVGAGAKE